jgi:NADPH2:quinone reductase
VRAVVLRRFGPPSELRAEDVAEPSVGDGQVLIGVDVANITYVETQVRAGRAPNPAMLPALPAVLGNGVGGVVAAVGGDVDTHWLGRRVVSSLRGTGGYAEQAVADAAALIDVPEGVSTQSAVAVLADGRTAILLVRSAAIQPGETVLVEAAAGGVGSLLVQLARAAGARVIGAAREGLGRFATVRSLGAQVAIDYSQPDWSDRLGEPVDVVFDGVGGEIGRSAFGLLRRGGRFVAFGMASGAFSDISADEAAARGVEVRRGMQATPAELRELSRTALAEAAHGRLRPLIGQTFPLERAADAHAAMERRETLGKTLLIVRDT